MYQYTTETIIIGIEGIDFADVEEFRVKMRGVKGELLKIVDADDADTEDSTIRVALTQEETASLGKGFMQMQVRVVTTDGDVYASNKEKVKVDSVLDEVVIL